MKFSKKRFSRIKKRYLSIALLFMILSTGSFTSAATSNVSNTDVYDLIMERIRADVKPGNITNIANQVTSALPLFNSGNGSFTDINYASKDQTNWPPMIHIDRLYNLVFAYTIEGNTYYQSEDLYNKIVQGFQYWYDVNPVSSNWWYNEIAEPKKLGAALVQMRAGVKQLPEQLEKITLNRMKTDGGNAATQTGANKLDVALHWLYRAILTKDAPLLSSTMGHAFEPIKFVTGEGIQHDYSYFQHKTQLYTMGYGDEVIKGTTQFAIFVAGTQFAMEKEKLDIFDTFVRKSFVHAIHGQFAHFNIMGRTMSRNGASKKTGMVQHLRKMVSINPVQADFYNDAIKRLEGSQPASYGIQPSNTFFYIGDYVNHTRPQYSVGVRTISTRTVRNEHMNGENLKTYFVSDGSTSIVVKGDEYEKIFPVWNWAKIPGTTAPQFKTIPMTTTYAPSGISTFAGGASDSLYSVTTLVYHDTFSSVNTAVKKSWFFFENELVCLGSDITSTSAFEVNTTLNQCLLQTDVLVSDNAGVNVVPKGDYTYTNPKWILQGGVGYVFPSGGSVNLSAKEQSGSWSDINTTQAVGTVKSNVFSLWFNHGLKPTKQAYAYTVVPNKKTAEEMNNYKADDIEVLANTDSVQVVRHKGLNIWQMVFFKAASFTHNDVMIKADKGCTLILKGVGTPKVTMHIADPARKASVIKIASLIPSISSDMKLTTCSFSGTGIHAGKTKVYGIDKNSESVIIFEPEDPEPSSAIYESVVLADAFVRDGGDYETVNYGASTALTVKLDGSGYRRDAFVKLSLSDIVKVDTATDTIKHITMALYIASANADVSSTKWMVYPVGNSNWSESTITAKNSPAADTKAVAEQTGRLKDESIGGFNPNNVVEFDITEYALAEYAKGKKEISLKISNSEKVAGSKHDASFASKEVATAEMRPTIRIKAYEKLTWTEVEMLAIDDAYVEQNSPNTSFGSTNSITIKNTGGASTDRRGYLKFDISNLKNIPAEAIGRVSLKLTPLWGNSETNIPQWIVKSVENQTWKESTITYANKPDVGATIASIQGFLPSENPNKPAIFDVTDYVLAQLSKGATTVSLFMYQSESGSKYDMAYASKENASADKHPKLIAEVDNLSYSSVANVESRSVNITVSTKEIKIYPNPVAVGGSITIDADIDAELLMGAKVEIFSTTGSRIAIQSLTGRLTSVRISASPGIYFAKVTDKNGLSKYAKFIVK